MFSKSHKKYLALFLTILWLTLIGPMALYAAPLETTADTAVLMEPQTGTILFEKNPHKKVAPASVTKLMTLLVAFDALDKGRCNLDDKVTTSLRAYEMGGSQIYLEPGEEMTLRDMLISISVQSANDACVAVAEHISGSYEAYVEEMNKKAAELGCKNTHFANPHGLPAENHYTSAYDMALIAKEALKYPKLREYVSIKHYEIRENTSKLMKLDNHNKLLWWYAGADGFKTGWTNEAKYCLVSTVERDNLRLIGAVFGVPEVRGHFQESMKLMNYGFARYGFKMVASPNAEMGEVMVNKGAQESLKAVVKGKAGLIVEKGKDKGISSKVELYPSVDAPVKTGQKVGELIILQDNVEKGRFNLVAKESVAKGSFLLYLKKTGQGMFGIN